MADCGLCGGELEARYGGPDELRRGFDFILEYPEVVVGNSQRDRTLKSELDNLQICQYCSATIKELIETLKDGKNPVNQFEQEQ